MDHIYGAEQGLLVILHGGAGPQDPSAEGIARAIKALKKIGHHARKSLLESEDALDVATSCLVKLESDPQFNAGYGSALQNDGIARLSASLMDGKKQTFSGVISASYLQHPSLLSKSLQKRHAKVLSPPGTELLAREIGIPVQSNITERRSKKWLKSLDDASYPADFSEVSDTVGCVIRDTKGHIVAASSTGGRGHEYPGRVSDTATVAGNYASKYAGIAATGHGEQITNDALAARIETRVRDGMSLEEANSKTFLEGIKRKRRYGWIALNKEGWAIAHTTKFMPFVVMNQKGVVQEFKLT